jgi:hypothetical protein
MFKIVPFCLGCSVEITQIILHNIAQLEEQSI